jgi:threonine dehydratase
MIVKYKDVVEARERIRQYIYNTPLEKSMHLSNKEHNVYLKLECQQRVKSFKIRGALSKLTSLTEQEKSKGIVTVSSGNHGAAVSYASGLLGIENATIFVPESTPKSKIRKIEYYGGHAKAVGKDYDETHDIAMNYLKEHDVTYVDPCSDREVISGQGTMAMEILEQNPEIDTILVPVGGGGMITGISVAMRKIKPSVKIIGLQTEACPAMIASLQDEKFYEVYPIEQTICDALVGGVGEIPYHMAKQSIDDIWEIKEAMIAKAVPLMINHEKIIAEPSGVIGVAAMLQEIPLENAKNIAIIISGGNIDDGLMLELLNKNDGINRGEMK